MNQIFQNLEFKADLNFILLMGSLIFTRLAMVTSTIPFLVGKPVPGQIRIGFALAMTIYMYPALAPSNASLLSKAPLFVTLLFMKEAFYGIAMGIAASIVFYAFQAVGDMIDNQRGAAQARLLIPQLGEQVSVFGSFNFLLGTTVFLSIGGHLLFLKSLVESYQFLPLLELPRAQPDFLMLSEEFIRMTATVLVLSLQLTAPILIAIFVADVVLGIMSKTAPAINVWELGFIVRGVIGVAVYFLSVGLLVDQMGKISTEAMGQVEKLIRILNPSTGA